MRKPDEVRGVKGSFGEVCGHNYVGHEYVPQAITISAITTCRSVKGSFGEVCGHNYIGHNYVPQAITIMRHNI